MTPSFSRGWTISGNPSYVTHMLQAGANIKEVQAAVGHDRIGSTMVYLHTAEGAAQRGQATLEKALAATEKPELKIIEGGK